MKSIKNMSVSAKGFVAFGLLAIIAIVTCSFIYVQAAATEALVEENMALIEERNEVMLLREFVADANLALKQFLLTGDSEMVGKYNDSNSQITKHTATLLDELKTNLPEEAALVAKAIETVKIWQTSVVDRQMDLMRHPMTVDLARAIELTGEGAGLLVKFNNEMNSVDAALQKRADHALSNQTDALNAVETISLAASVLVTVVAAFLGFLNFRLVSQPLGNLAQVTGRLADGDLDVKIDADGKDEIGRMADAVKIFREAAIANRRLEAEAIENRKHAEEDRIETQQRAEADAAERLRVATSDLGAGLKRLASGDLSFRLEKEFAPDFEALRHDFNASVEHLGSTLASVSSSTSMMGTGTREIANATGDLAKRTELQAAALEETAAAVEEITVNVRNSTERTDDAKKTAAEATKSAQRSAEIVGNAEQAMERIEASSQEISNILSVMDEIAFQTNLLALNAGVEAARAGEAGKGFAVVAQEVRELAQRSASAAKEIKELISKSSIEVTSGVGLVRDTGEALTTIGTFIVEINEHMESIAISAKEQSQGLTEVNQAIGQMDQTTQQNAAMVEESNAASADLAGEAGKLRDLMVDFKFNMNEEEYRQRSAA